MITSLLAAGFIAASGVPAATTANVTDSEFLTQSVSGPRPGFDNVPPGLSGKTTNPSTRITVWNYHFPNPTIVKVDSTDLDTNFFDFTIEKFDAMVNEYKDELFHVSTEWQSLHYEYDNGDIVNGDDSVRTVLKRQTHFAKLIFNYDIVMHDHGRAYSSRVPIINAIFQVNLK